MQILINTISNATKFTNHGHVMVYIDYIEGDQILEQNMKPHHLESYDRASENIETLMELLNEEGINENPKEKYDHLTSSKNQFKFDRKTVIEQVSPVRSPELDIPLNKKLSKIPSIRKEDS